jgi:hypothetical protein
LQWLLYIMGATALVNPEYVAAAYFKVQPTAYASHLGRCLGAVCFMLTGAVYYLQVRRVRRAAAMLDSVSNRLTLIADQLLLMAWRGVVQDARSRDQYARASGHRYVLIAVNGVYAV